MRYHSRDNKSTSIDATRQFSNGRESLNERKASGTVAPLWLDLWEASGGELGGYGVQHSDSLLHATIRDYEHRLLQVENEQGSRLHDVPPLLRLRRCFAHVRVRDTSLSGLGEKRRAKCS